MKNRVLLFFPHNPCPAKSGAHKRCISMLSALKELGLETTFVSTEVFTDNAWSQNSIETLKSKIADNLYIYKKNSFDETFRNVYRATIKNRPLDAALFSPPLMRFWFRKIIDNVSPDILIMSYTYWNKLVREYLKSSVKSIIDAYEVACINNAMIKAVEHYLPASKISPEQVDPEILNLRFFDNRRFSLNREEFNIYDQYEYTVTVAKKEAQVVAENTIRTKSKWIPITNSTSNFKMTYSDSAILAIGPNLFNIQGYLFFIKEVLPLIRKSEPNFQLDVTGVWCNRIPEAENVNICGFVQELEDKYQTARFAICPIFGGTGQQVKVLEAMSYGLPVVAIKNAAESAPIRHKENGLIAETADEFAEYCINLWQDKELCKKLGNEAKETVRKEYSEERLLKELAAMFCDFNLF